MDRDWARWSWSSSRRSQYALAPTLLVSNAGAGLVIVSAGSDDQQARWLPGIASGEQRGALAMTADDPPIAGAADGAALIVLPNGTGRGSSRARRPSSSAWS